jgi:mycothiol synthase
VPDISSDVPDEATRGAILALAESIEAEDGAPPLSDDALTQLDSPHVEHWTAREAGRLSGYAQRRDGAAELAAQPAVLNALLDAVTKPDLLVWAHGRRSRLAEPLAGRGFVRTRELYQLRRTLTDLPPEAPLPDGVQIRPFRAGQDEQAWLRVNAAAFHTHPEQGRRTLAELHALMAEPWFAPADFLLAERGDELLGFHWMKRHSQRLGEVYVLGVAPAAQGLGLGHALLNRGLHHLADAGCTEVLLYVEGDNHTARGLYERAGFAQHDVDVQWRAPAD